MAANVVPFGKYKDKPVEVLLNDQDYCNWLTAQPWFRERFGGIYQIIMQTGNEPVETPEHNEMQAWFLRDEACLKLAQFLRPTAGWDKATRQVQIPKKLQKALEEHPTSFVTEYCEASLDRRRFEDAGWDVTFSVGLPWYHTKCLELPCICICSHSLCSQTAKCVGGDGYCHHSSCVSEDGKRQHHCDRTCIAGDYELSRQTEWNLGAYDQVSVLLELKPDLGDDYPAVLRQVLRYDYERGDIRCVLVRRYAFERVSWDDVVEIYRSSGVRLCSAADVKRTIESP